MSSEIGYYRRCAYHSGSWYSDEPEELDATLSKFMNNVDVVAVRSGGGGGEDPTLPQPPLRGVICPHAGYSYSGPTAAYSYVHLQKEIHKPSKTVTTILVLHPSHHVYLDGCAVSGATVLETPCGNLCVDDDVREEILKLGHFSVMQKTVDEREHSGEMQYPYIAKALGPQNLDKIKVLPIMCGSISSKQEEMYGKILAPIIARPNVMCVISTDFCHWGHRFQYQPTPTGGGTTSTKQIFQHIQELDHQGMSLIELQQPGAFAKYLKETRNTICGRHAIGVWLNAVHWNSLHTEELEIEFVKYAQSSQVTSMRDSSVSYASATARRRKKSGGV